LAAARAWLTRADFSRRPNSTPIVSAALFLSCHYATNCEKIRVLAVSASQLPAVVDSGNFWPLVWRGLSIWEESHKLNECWQVFCIFDFFSGLAVRVMIVGRRPAGNLRSEYTPAGGQHPDDHRHLFARAPSALSGQFPDHGSALPFCCTSGGWRLFDDLHVRLYYERIMLTEEAF